MPQARTAVFHDGGGGGVGPASGMQSATVNGSMLTDSAQKAPEHSSPAGTASNVVHEPSQPLGGKKAVRVGVVPAGGETPGEGQRTLFAVMFAGSTHPAAGVVGDAQEQAPQFSGGVLGSAYPSK